MTHGVREDQCRHRSCRKAQRIIDRSRPEAFPTGQALRVAGLRDDIHPDDAYATLHPTREDAEVFRVANALHYGHPGWVVPMEGGFIQIIDLRPMLAENDVLPTDPSLPDGK